MDSKSSGTNRRGRNGETKLRFLFLCNKDPWNPKAGGGTLELFRLMVLLTARGHEVTLLSSHFRGAPRQEYLEGVKIIRLGNILTIFLLAPFKLFSMRKSFDAVVDVALFGIPFFSRLYSNKPMLTICYHLPRETFRTELSRFGPLGQVLGSLAIEVEDRFYPSLYRQTPLLTFSDATKDDLIKTGFSPLKIHVADRALAHVMLTNSFETDIIRKRMVSYVGTVEKPSEPFFVVLGRLKRYKGVQDAIRAITELVGKYPNARLAIVGTGDYEIDLRKLSAELSVDQNVLFMGYVPFETKVKLLKEATALIMPSYKEGFPTPILEAQACGTPVVASNAVGVYEYAVGQENNFIFPVGDWKSIASLLAKVIEANGSASVREGNNGSSLAMDWERREGDLAHYVESCLS